MSNGHGSGERFAGAGVVAPVEILRLVGRPADILPIASAERVATIGPR
jgi:hypothetical protein